MRSQQPTDQQLIRQYLEGKDQSFDQLLLRHKNQVFTKIYMMVKDEDTANDIFQDTFIKVIQTLKAGKYNEEGKFLPWLMRIAHNLTIDHFRKGKKMPAVRSDDNKDIFAMISQDGRSVEDQMCWDRILADVKALLEMLPADQRTVVHQRHYQGLSFKEIAERNDISINTALGRMRYALINLRKLMEEHKVSLTMI